LYGWFKGSSHKGDEYPYQGFDVLRSQRKANDEFRSTGTKVRLFYIGSVTHSITRVIQSHDGSRLHQRLTKLTSQPLFRLAGSTGTKVRLFYIGSVTHSITRVIQSHDGSRLCISV
jgi:hypothetical protein